MKRLGFKPWEFALLIFALILVGGSSWIYVSGFPLRKYLFGSIEQAGFERVGKLSDKTGAVRRQYQSGTEFQAIEKDVALYNQDTIVTGPGGSAVISLGDGGQIELGENTMVQLSFESRLSLGGISRAASVNVVVGNVAGQSKQNAIRVKTRDNRVISLSKDKKEVVKVAAAPLIKPPPRPVPLAKATPRAAPIPTAPPEEEEEEEAKKVAAAASPTPAPVVIAAASPAPSPSASPEAAASPSPSPSPSPIPSPSVLVAVQVKILAPREGMRISIDKGSKEAKKTVTLEWSVKPADFATEVVVRKLGGAESFKSTVTPKNGKGSVQVSLTAAGDHEWELRRPTGEPLAGGRGRFHINPQFEALETLPPLVGGKTLESNEYTDGEVLSKFDITVRWKTFPGAEEYVVRLLNAPNAARPLVEKSVKDAQFTFNKDKVYAGTLFYSVAAKVGGGFLVTASPRPFVFNFKAPRLVIPENGARVESGGLSGTNNSILMTWQKTNFTDGYELELSSDQGFAKIVQKHKTKENFLVLKAPKAGNYWWRVRGYQKDLMSPYSPANQIVFTP